MALAVAALLVVGLLAFDVLSYTYRHLGISIGWMALILATALLGSFINIPIARLRSQVRQTTAPVSVFGVTYRIPVPGVGIVTPALCPPLAAALAAIWLGGYFIAAVAYAAGTIGTLATL